MNVAEFGPLGRMEAARQALEEAGERGLTGPELMRAAGYTGKSGRLGGGKLQSFLATLTAYCYVAEEDRPGSRNRCMRPWYILVPEMDERFERRIVIDNTKEETA